jgi:transposase
MRSMGMGKRKRYCHVAILIPASDLPTAPSHPFYRRLNQLLHEHDFDAFVEGLCARFYAARMGRPSLAPGIYFRLLLVGYFEGLDSERGIAWRATDSLALRAFLGLALSEAPPDHSTISRTRRLIDLETHRAVFAWILRRVADAGLLKGKTIGVDATTLEANAALRSIVRRDTGEAYQEYLKKLAQASGVTTPTREDLAKVVRKRKKKGSNKEWKNPHDPDAKITKMKDGRTHLAHKAEHGADLETGAVVAVTVQDADAGDTKTMIETLITAAEQVEAVGLPGIAEMVADKGYHSNQSLEDLQAVGVRAHISEPKRGRRHWRNKPVARVAVYANRRRIRGTRGLRLLRRRGEYLERSFAHTYETGGMRRTHLRGHRNILKRAVIHAGGFNLGLIMRRLIGVGTPRGLQGRVAALIAILPSLIRPHRLRVIPCALIATCRHALTSLNRAAVTPSAAATCTTVFHEKAGRCQEADDHFHLLLCGSPFLGCG